MVAVKNEGKTAFVKDVLAKNATANAQAVNEAWTAAGHKGTISTTLVQNCRSDLGLTGNLRSGRKAAKTNGAHGKSKVQGKKRGRPPKSSGGAGVRTNGASSKSDFVKRSTSFDRERMLDELEGEIDRLIFRIMTLEGLSAVEEALRRARRLVVLSQHA